MSIHKHIKDILSHSKNYNILFECFKNYEGNIILCDIARSFLLKSNSHLIIASFTQSLKYYQNIFSKLNLNIDHYIRTKSLSFVNVLDSIKEKLNNSDESEFIDTQIIYQNIKQIITNSKKENIVLILDEPDILLNVGYRLKTLVQLIDSYLQLVHNVKGTLICKVSKDNVEESRNFIESLSHSFDYYIIHKALLSGYNKDFQERIEVIHYNHFSSSSQFKVKFDDKEGVKYLPELTESTSSTVG